MTNDFMFSNKETEFSLFDGLDSEYLDRHEQLRRWRCPPKKLNPEPIIFDFFMYSSCSDVCKEIFRKYFIEGGVTYKEIAKTYGFTPNNARQCAHRCYWKTRRFLLNEGVLIKEEHDEYYDEKKAAKLKERLEITNI